LRTIIRSKRLHAKGLGLDLDNFRAD
jgi:hypothetical protein